MTLNLTIPPQMHTDFTPRITVIGVGGGGTNAVDNMIAMQLQGVDFVVANTDAQQLMHSRADRRIQLGPHLTQGLGAGAKPEVGRAAAEEAADELYRHLDGTHMVFITAGMGGGTGTGAAPVIARMARERNILTVGVVTKPFKFEGNKRCRAAEAGIAELQQYVDTLIVIPNQNLFLLSNERTSWKDAFKMADNVLYMGVRGVTDLMVTPGMVNLDFADIRTVMAEMGKAMMGTGEAEGEGRAIRAAEAAISNPLLEDTCMAGAKGLLINITGGDDLTFFEVDQAANRIREEVDDEANIIFGSAIDESLNGKIRVSVVATGIESQHDRNVERPRLVVGSDVVANAQAAQPVAQPAPGLTLVGDAAGVRAPVSLGQTGFPQTGLRHLAPGQMPAADSYGTEFGVTSGETDATPEASEPRAAAPQTRVIPDQLRKPVVPQTPRQRPALPARPGGLFAPEPQTAAAPPATAPAPGGIKSLFSRVTARLGAGGEAPHAPPTAAAPQPAYTEDTSHIAPEPAQQAGDDLDIPTFLRRQTSQTNRH